jgi:hypothetical protein
MRRLALGRLADAEAARAEEILHQCSSCREQWQQVLEGDQASQVAAAVADVTGSFVPPRRRHWQVWWAAAAAIVFAFSALWFVSPDLPMPPDRSVTMADVTNDKTPNENHGNLIHKLDFESGEVLSVVREPEAQPEEILFMADFESGSLNELVINRS